MAWSRPADARRPQSKGCLSCRRVCSRRHDLPCCGNALFRCRCRPRGPEITRMTWSVDRAGSAIGAFVLTATLLGALLAPWIAPYGSDVRFNGLLNAPPTVVHILGADGRMRSPYIH